MSFNMDFFIQELRKRKEYVEKYLDKFLGGEPQYPPLIHQAMHYAVLNGGKRLRPIMVLEGARIAGGKIESVMPTACAMEMIHSYSLVHDDLPAMDDDDLRRGKPTCHKVFGEANAILTGDGLLTAAFQIIAEAGKLPGADAVRLLRVIGDIACAAGSEGMIGGQVMDLNSEYLK